MRIIVEKNCTCLFIYTKTLPYTTNRFFALFFIFFSSYLQKRLIVTWKPFTIKPIFLSRSFKESKFVWDYYLKSPIELTISRLVDDIISERPTQTPCRFSGSGESSPFSRIGIISGSTRSPSLRTRSPNVRAAT